MQRPTITGVRGWWVSPMRWWMNSWRIVCSAIELLSMSWYATDSTNHTPRSSVARWFLMAQAAE